MIMLESIYSIQGIIQFIIIPVTITLVMESILISALAKALNILSATP